MLFKIWDVSYTYELARGGGGAKGSLMEETALKNILEAVYGKNAIVHIMTQKAVRRASRGYLLVEKCIHSQLTAEMTQEDPEIQILLYHAKDVYSSFLRGKTTLADNTCYAILIKLERATEWKKHELAHISKTSEVWLNYQLMINNSNMLIKAYRTGCWTMHKQAVADLLSIFAVPGYITCNLLITTCICSKQET